MNPTNEPQDTNNNNLAPVPQSVVPEPPSAPTIDQQPAPSLDAQPVVPTPTPQPEYNAADIYPASTVEEQTPIQPVVPTNAIPSQEPNVMPASDLSQITAVDNVADYNGGKTPVLLQVFFATMLATIVWWIYRIIASALSLKKALNDELMLSFFFSEISVPYIAITIMILSLIVLGLVSFKMWKGKYWALIAISTYQLIYVVLLLVVVSLVVELFGVSPGKESSLGASIAGLMQLALLVMTPVIWKKHRQYFV